MWLWVLDGAVKADICFDWQARLPMTARYRKGLNNCIRSPTEHAADSTEMLPFVSENCDT